MGARPQPANTSHSPLDKECCPQLPKAAMPCLQMRQQVSLSQSVQCPQCLLHRPVADTVPVCHSVRPPLYGSHAAAHWIVPRVTLEPSMVSSSSYSVHNSGRNDKSRSHPQKQNWAQCYKSLANASHVSLSFLCLSWNQSFTVHSAFFSCARYRSSLSECLVHQS